MFRLINLWRYWRKRGHGLCYSWHLACNTIDEDYLATTRRKHRFNLPNLWRKL